MTSASKSVLTWLSGRRACFLARVSTGRAAMFYAQPICAGTIRLRDTRARALLWCMAEVGGYLVLAIVDIPSPNTTVFSVLWPASIALWGSLGSTLAIRSTGATYL
jgi:hypothetical protein